MSNWFTYDWMLEGSPARFAVDLAFGEIADPAQYPVALRLSCLDPGSKGSLGGRALRHADALERAALKAGLLLCGRVELADCMQLYFYGKRLSCLSDLEYVSRKEKLLSVQADAQEDPEWSFYEAFLCPDAAKFQTEQNRERIERIRRAGDNTATARRVRLHMFFPAEPLRARFAEQARAAGFALGESEFQPEMERAHGLVIIRISTLNKPDVDALTTQAIYLAQPFEGTLGYWDCPLIPKNHPLR